MDCPACHRPRGAGTECPHCGVIYARAEARRAAAPPPLPPSPPPPTGPSRGAHPAAVALAMLGLIAAGGGAIVALRGAPAAPGEDAPADSVPATAAATAGAPLPPLADLEPAPAGWVEPAGCDLFDPADVVAAPAPPALPPEWHDGSAGYQRALAEQAETGAPLLVLFHTEWCPHCRRFIAEVIPSPEARRLGERLAKAKVNAEGDGEERALAARYGVRRYPTLLLFPGGDAPPVRLAAWGTPGRFVEACERAMPSPGRARLERGIALARRRGDDARAAEELKAAAADGALARTALDHLGLLALRARCFGAATAVYGRVLELDADDQGGRAHHLRGLARLRSGDRAGALDDADQACRRGLQDACRVVARLRGKAG